MKILKYMANNKKLDISMKDSFPGPQTVGEDPRFN